MTLEYWFMLPVATVIATIAMASGIGGATFFTLFLILALKLPPEVAIGTGLITEVFGFASGVYAYARKKLIDFRLSMSLLAATVPMAILGTLLAGWIPSTLLKIVLGVGLIVVTLSFLKSPSHTEVERADQTIQKDYGGEKGETKLITAEGEIITYTVCNRTEGGDYRRYRWSLCGSYIYGSRRIERFFSVAPMPGSQQSLRGYQRIRGCRYGPLCFGGTFLTIR
jgi:hypothetical protein